MRLTEQQVGLKMAGLPERFADRIQDNELQKAIRYRNVGEWAEVLGSLIAALHQGQTPITTREKQSLQDFLETFRPVLTRTDIGTRDMERMILWLDDLKVVRSLSQQQMIDRLRTIPARFAGRIPPQDLELLTVSPDEEEPGIWFETAYDLIRMLRQHQVAISSQERTELSMILDALDLPRLELTQLPAS